MGVYGTCTICNEKPATILMDSKALSGHCLECNQKYNEEQSQELHPAGTGDKIAALAKRNRELAGESAEIEIGNAVLLSQIAALRAERDQLERAKQSWYKTATKTKSELDYVRQQIAALEHNLESAEDLARLSEKQFRNEEYMHKQTKAERDALQAENARLKSDIGALLCMVDALPGLDTEEVGGYLGEILSGTYSGLDPLPFTDAGESELTPLDMARLDMRAETVDDVCCEYCGDYQEDFAAPAHSWRKELICDHCYQEEKALAEHDAQHGIVTFWLDNSESDHAPALDDSERIARAHMIVSMSTAKG